MIHGLPIAAPSPSCPGGPAQRWVAQLRCILPHPLLFLTRFLPDFRSETTPPNPSRDPVPPPSDYSPSASPPSTHASSPSPQP